MLIGEESQSGTLSGGDFRFPSASRIQYLRALAECTNATGRGVYVGRVGMRDSNKEEVYSNEDEAVIVTSVLLILPMGELLAWICAVRPTKGYQVE
jgi:hypothetical protein